MKTTWDGIFLEAFFERISYVLMCVGSSRSKMVEHFQDERRWILTMLDLMPQEHFVTP
jgi:hypothetical protein